MSGGWLHPDDWHGAAVSAMVRAVIDDEGLAEASAELGAERASRGVGLTEGLDDLAALFSVASRPAPPFHIVKAFSEAWVDVSTAAILARGATDSLTGLRTSDYLEARLVEVYSAQRATGIPASESHTMIVVSGDRLTGWKRVLRSCAIARIVSEVLSSGETNVILRSGTIVSIVGAASALEHSIRIRHRLLVVDDAEEVTVELRELPDDYESAVLALVDL